MMQEFVSSMKKAMQAMIDEIHTAVPATISSYDAATNMATVQPEAKYKKPNAETIDYPVVSGVPVVFPQSETVAIAFPVKAGDKCLLVFSETALDYWQYGQETDTDLKFDLSNAIAIPNLMPSGNEAMQSACDEDAAIIKAGDTVLKVKSDAVYITGKLHVTGNITCDSDVTASGVSLKSQQ
ncbi:MAG: hypothetical protein LIO94_09535 [Clostridiales bacterium]|nr:hypothetical protein [Clostridiales bacterium]